MEGNFDFHAADGGPLDQGQGQSFVIGRVGFLAEAEIKERFLDARVFCQLPEPILVGG